MDRGRRDVRADEGGLRSRPGESVSGSFEVSLSQRLHPLASLGHGLVVLPVVVCYSLKCPLED